MVMCCMHHYLSASLYHDAAILGRLSCWMIQPEALLRLPFSAYSILHTSTILHCCIFGLFIRSFGALEELKNTIEVWLQINFYYLNVECRVAILDSPLGVQNEINGPEMLKLMVGVFSLPIPISCQEPKNTHHSTLLLPSHLRLSSIGCPSLNCFHTTVF